MNIENKLKTSRLKPLFILLTVILIVPLLAVGNSEAQDLDARYKGALKSMRPHIISITVKNVDESVKWYTEKLGFTFFKKIDVPKRHLRMRFLKHNTGFMLELVEMKGTFHNKEKVPDLKKRFMVHGVYKFGFWVNDLDAVYRKLKRMGAKLLSEPLDDIPFNSRTILLDDNDGNRIQIFETLKTKGKTGETE